MDVQKFSDFILNEARVNKEEVVKALTDMLKKKPHVEMDKLPNEKGLYGLAGMKKHLSGKYTANQVDLALHDLKNDKNSGIKSVYVKVSHWKKSMPYWYMDLTDEQVEKIKSQYEEEESSKNKADMDKNDEKIKTQKAAKEAKEEAKEQSKKARTAPKKAVGKGVTRKAGSAPKKRVSRKK